MKIVLDVPAAAAVLLEKHAAELGYPDAADWLFELGRNYCAQREDDLYTRMTTGADNPVFGCSRREQADRDRSHAEAAVAEAAVAAQVKANAKREAADGAA